MDGVRVWQAKYHEGHCQGCGTNNGVYVIQANTWQTRFCWQCLRDVMRQAGMHKRDLKAS